MKRADANRILLVVAARLGVSVEDIRSQHRVAAIVRARWLTWALLRRLGASYPEIGAATGHDHTSVMHGVWRVDKAPEEYRGDLDLLARLVLAQRDMSEAVTCPTCGGEVRS